MRLTSPRKSSEGANSNRPDKPHGPRHDQQNPSANVQITRRPISHDRLDSSLQIGAAHARRTYQRRRHIKPANVENPFRVDPWVTAEPQNFFIARSLPLLHHPLPDPPHQRMEPEDSLDE